MTQRLETKRWYRKTNVVTTALDKWIKDGLHARSITRDIVCGISVPLAWYELKKLYVRFEACLGYISITQYRANLTWNDRKKYRLDPQTQLIQFIWKDNIVFHSIIWPALLIWHNSTHINKYILPTVIPANEFLNLEGKKFSTSRNYAVWLWDITRDFDPEYVRYYLTTCIPETADSNFYRKEFQLRSNDLCDTIWNLVSRLASLHIRYPDTEQRIDQTLYTMVRSQRIKISSAFEQFHIRDALYETIQIFKYINQYISDTKLREHPEYISSTIWALLHGSALLEPFLPTTAHRIQEIFCGCEIMIHSDHIWDSAYTPDILKLDTKPEHIFVKISNEIIDQHIQLLWNQNS